MFLTFDLKEGFRNNRVGRTMAAFVAMDFMAEFEAKAL